MVKSLYSVILTLICSEVKWQVAKLKHSLTLMCVIYTVIISGMFLCGFILSDSASLLVPTPSKALMMLLFSAFLGVSSLILSKEGTGVARTLLHYISCLVSFVLTVILGCRVNLAGAGPMIAVIGFTAVYAVVMIVRGIILRRKSKKIEIQQEYTAVFK